MNETTTTPLTIQLSDIIVGDRLRKEYGDLSDLDTIAEVGLIQPIVLNYDDRVGYSLVAGGRRYAKLVELGYKEVTHSVTADAQRPGFVFATELPPDIRREIELYENIGRKAMTWQERVNSIAEIHNLKIRRAAIDRETWGLRESGAELGLNFSTVSRMVLIAEELKNPDSTIHECKNVTEAVRWLIERKEDEAKRALAQLTIGTVPKPTSSADIPVAESNETFEAGTAPLVVPLSRMLIHTDSGRWMRDIAEPESVHHIISDWPYAIDMDYLEQGNGMKVDRVRLEHDAAENAANYPYWLSGMFRVLKDGGFCVLFYDNVHYQYIASHAEATGFRVQRWPLVWIKTSPCLNQMANKNWTKATEFAIVLSKGNSLLVKPQATNFWSGPRASTTSNPFAKPSGLWQWIMAAVCTKGETVLDPFAGEGSSTLAAIDFGLRPIAVESNDNHYNTLVLNTKAKYDVLTNENVRYE